MLYVAVHDWLGVLSPLVVLEEREGMKAVAVSVVLLLPLSSQSLLALLISGFLDFL